MLFIVAPDTGGTNISKEVVLSTLFFIPITQGLQPWGVYYEYIALTFSTFFHGCYNYGT
jgi:hypothetical protein